MTPFFLPRKKHLIVTGHYGSGKTHVAVNLALALRRQGAPVTLVDLDTVNPYFRAADARERLYAAGVRPVFPDFANTNVDIPALPAEIGSVFAAPRPGAPAGCAIFDVGGDSGAVALGAYSARFKQDGYEMLYVVNPCRPLTATPEEAVALLREIEGYARLTHTAVVHNPNLGELTTPALLTDTLPFAEAVCRLSGLPLAFVACLPPAGEDWDNSLGPDLPLLCMEPVTKKLF